MARRLLVQSRDLRSLERRHELIEGQALWLAQSVGLDAESGLAWLKRVLWERGEVWASSFCIGLGPRPD